MPLTAVVSLLPNDDDTDPDPYRWQVLDETGWEVDGGWCNLVADDERQWATLATEHLAYQGYVVTGEWTSTHAEATAPVTDATDPPPARAA